MAGKREKPEDIVLKLRQVEVLQGQGRSTAEAVRQFWAALSTSGMRGLHLPADPHRLTIAPDGDAPGREAAHALAERGRALGWDVSLLPAPDGRDWNDILTMKGESV